jgi:hypothetical protein
MPALPTPGHKERAVPGSIFSSAGLYASLFAGEPSAWRKEEKREEEKRWGETRATDKWKLRKDELKTRDRRGAL